MFAKDCFIEFQELLNGYQIPGIVSYSLKGSVFKFSHIGNIFVMSYFCMYVHMHIVWGQIKFLIKLWSRYNYKDKNSLRSNHA